MTRHFHPAHRRQAIHWARSLLAHPFYVLDTETTGLGKEDEIVQIGIVDRDGGAVMNQLIKPSVAISPGAAAKHGFSARDLADAPSFTSIYIKLSALLAGQVVVSYNMEFDWRMLQQTAARCRLPDLRLGKRDCAMKQYARFKGARRSGGRGYIWHKLAAAARQEGVQIRRAHDALDDARMTLALINKMAQAM